MTTTGSTISLDSASSQYVSLTDGVDCSGDYTVCWWMTSPAGLSNYGGVATFETADANSGQYYDQLMIQKGNSESQWRAGIHCRSHHPTVSTYTGFVIGAAPWFVTYKRDGDDVTCRVYHGATYTEGTVTRVTTGRSSVGETSLGAWKSGAATPGGGTTTAEFAHFKAWSRALTDSELAREKEFSRAQIRDSIVGEWAMRGGSVLRDLDYSGRGNALVETASPTDGFTSFGVAVAPQPIIVEPAAATDVDVTPGTGSLTTTLFAPTVVATDHISVTPATASLVTTLFAPTAAATAHVSVTPATVALATALFAPVVVATADISVTPSTGSLVTTLFAPVIQTNSEVFPVVGSLAVSGFAPTVVSSTPRSIITTGQWSTPVDFAVGDEWVVTCQSATSANAPRVRIQLLFT